MARECCDVKVDFERFLKLFDPIFTSENNIAQLIGISVFVPDARKLYIVHEVTGIHYHLLNTEGRIDLIGSNPYQIKMMTSLEILVNKIYSKFDRPQIAAALNSMLKTLLQ